MHLSKPRNFGLLKAIGAEINLQSSKADSNHDKLRILYLNGRNHVTNSLNIEILHSLLTLILAPLLTRYSMTCACP